ncbi:hypothetical protein K8I85_03150 [bacterium]|nr:hypothetical protein [bacterium]
MKMTPVALLLAAALTAGGCGDDESTAPTGPGTVVIQFDEVAGSDALVLNTGQYTNAVGNEYSVSKLEYVVSAFSFPAAVARLRADGDFTSTALHYRTMEDAATASLTFADVPSGSYTGMGFTFGIDGADNATGTHPDLDLDGMAWPAMMGGGYHYMRHEGNFTDSTMATSAFTTHLGPSMGNDYSFEVSLAHDFTVSPGETTTLTVRMDVNEWYVNPNMYDFNDHGPIMGDPAAQTTLQANGASVFSVAP